MTDEKPPQAKIVHYTPATYKAITIELLRRHKLDVPEPTIEMLTKTICKCSILPAKIRGNSEFPYSERIAAAHGAAQRLLEYTKRRVSHPDSIRLQLRKLRDAIEEPTIIAGIPVGIVHISNLLDELDSSVAHEPSVAKAKAKLRPFATKLQILIDALETIRSRGFSSTGAPRSRNASIVSAGCIAWRRAGRTDTYNNWETTNAPESLPPDNDDCFLRSELVEFLIELFDACHTPISKTALHSAMKSCLPTIINILKQ